MFSFFLLNPILAKIDTHTPVVVPVPFKLQINDIFVNGPNSKAYRSHQKLIVVDTLLLKPPTIFKSEIAYPSCLRNHLFLKSFQILMNRYENGECYIPSSRALHVLGVIIDFAFQNNRDPLSIKSYLASLLGNIFHGTDFLSNLGPQEDYNSKEIEYNVGRGVIQIYGLETYRLVTKLSTKIDYVATPGALAVYTKEATEDSLKVYNKLCGDFFKKNKPKDGMTFYNTMEALKLDSLIAIKTNKKYPADIQKRIMIYKRICHEFEILGHVGKPVKSE